MGHNSEAIQVIVEEQKETYRSYYLGDPDFVKPLKALMDDDYLKQRMSNFSFEKLPYHRISKKEK
jgi:gamma-glutamyltranspeptidase/glutathione hydrolase